MRPLARFLIAAGCAGALALTAPAAIAAKPVDLRSIRVTKTGAFARVDGADAKLTIDPSLQRVADDLLASARVHEGAIVVSDVRTGKILAWATRGDRDYVAQLIAPSASLFKIVTAAALLDEGKATPATRACYDGGGEHEVELADLDRRGSVCTTMGEALGHSINLVFARLALKDLSPIDLERYATALGMKGDPFADVTVAPSELAIPADRLGFARASAGFWNGRLSPLGALFAMQTIANDGVRVKLSVLDRSGGARVEAGRAMSAASAQALTKMLEITTRRGTAAKAFKNADGSPALPFPVAAKTGTLVGGKPSRMYSWFAGFAPSTHPEVAIAVMLGNDVTWTTKASIVGRDLLAARFGVKHAHLARARRTERRRR